MTKLKDGQMQKRFFKFKYITTNWQKYLKTKKRFMLNLGEILFTVLVINGKSFKCAKYKK